MNFILIFKKIKSKIDIFKRTSINLFYICLIFLLSQKNKIHYKIKNSNILIVRIDALGDMFLSLHQAYEIKKKFNDSKLILICRKQYFDYIKSLDIFDEIISLDYHKFNSNFLYKLKFLFSINHYKFNLILNTCYSRCLSSDLISLFVSSNKKIGFYGNTSNQNRLIKRITNSWYSESIRIGNYEENLPHEVITNNFFLKHLNINTKPKIFNVKKNPSFAIKIQYTYFVIFPGSSNSLRNWKVENFINIAKLICEKYRLVPVICGNSSEISLSKKIISTSPHLNWYSLVGETSIGQLVEVIRNASFLISNETSAVHIAESVGTKCFCILGGGHFGRFAPYSENNLDSCSVSIFKNLPCFNCNWKCTLIKPENTTYPCIDNISVNDVMEKIEFFYSSNKGFT